VVRITSSFRAHRWAFRPYAGPEAKVGLLTAAGERVNQGPMNSLLGDGVAMSSGCRKVD
jgi:hypothetical protein